jgi:SAM-dependent methyltransferase
MKAEALELIDCPYCGADDYQFWGGERGFDTVRCKSCSFLYVNPRPRFDTIDRAVRSGAHGAEAEWLDVRARRIEAKVGRYQRWIGDLFADVWQRGSPISWLDVGAGYGEVVEAVSRLAPPGSDVRGLEPMGPKAEAARARGLNIEQDYLRPGREKVAFLSTIDVFSHIPDFHDFLELAAASLKPLGEILIETGNLADVSQRKEFPFELGLPDHLAFAGEGHLRGYLDKAGFDVLRLDAVRVDGTINFAKSVVKKLIGRPGQLRLPYRSSYRQLLVRARLRKAG